MVHVCLQDRIETMHLKQAMFIFDALSLPPTSWNPVLFPDYISFQFKYLNQSAFSPHLHCRDLKSTRNKVGFISYQHPSIPTVYLFHLVSMSDHCCHVGSQCKTRKLSKIDGIIHLSNSVKKQVLPMHFSCWMWLNSYPPSMKESRSCM